MGVFDEIVNDIVFSIDSLEFKSLEENLLKVDLLMNINRLLISEKEYKKNINILNNNITRNDEVGEDDRVFNRVSTSIINTIANLKYSDKDKIIIHSELLFNIYNFLISKKEYMNNIRLLNGEIDKDRVFSLNR